MEHIDKDLHYLDMSGTIRNRVQCLLIQVHIGASHLRLLNWHHCEKLGVDVDFDFGVGIEIDLESNFHGRDIQYCDA